MNATIAKLFTKKACRELPRYHNVFDAIKYRAKKGESTLHWDCSTDEMAAYELVKELRELGYMADVKGLRETIAVIKW